MLSILFENNESYLLVNFKKKLLCVFYFYFLFKKSLCVSTNVVREWVRRRQHVANHDTHWGPFHLVPQKFRSISNIPHKLDHISPISEKEKAKDKMKVGLVQQKLENNFHHCLLTLINNNEGNEIRLLFGPINDVCFGGFPKWCLFSYFYNL